MRQAVGEAKSKALLVRGKGAVTPFVWVLRCGLGKKVAAHHHVSWLLWSWEMGKRDMRVVRPRLKGIGMWVDVYHI